VNEALRRAAALSAYDRDTIATNALSRTTCTAAGRYSADEATLFSGTAQRAYRLA